MTNKKHTFRATYIRNGQVKHMTFGATNAATAALFAYTVLDRCIKSLDKDSFVMIVSPIQRRQNASTT